MDLGSFGTAVLMVEHNHREQKQKPGARPGFLLLHLRAKRAVTRSGQLLGGHLFGFAFLAHHFQLAFRGFEFCVDFLLDAFCRFFQLG